MNEQALTEKELVELINKSNNQLMELRDKKRKNFHKTPEYKILQDEAAEINKEVNQFVKKKFKFNINIPIEFSLKFQKGEEHGYSSIIDCQLSGKIAKGNTLTKDQKEIIYEFIQNMIQDSYDEINEFIPEETRKEIKTLNEKYTTIIDKIDDLGLDPKNLNLVKL